MTKQHTRWSLSGCKHPSAAAWMTKPWRKTLRRQRSSLLPQLPSACAPDTAAREHGDELHVKDVIVQNVNVAEETLVVHLAAKPRRTKQDTRWPLPGCKHPLTAARMTKQDTRWPLPVCKHPLTAARMTKQHSRWPQPG